MTNKQKAKSDKRKTERIKGSGGGPKGWPGDRVDRWTGVNVSPKQNIADTVQDPKSEPIRGKIKN